MKPSILKKLHETQIEILDEIDRICKKHDITYFLFSGTLLGAVRHKGFIPWDDDVDVALPRKDYEKFLEICKSELSDNFDVLSDSIKTYSILFAKVQKKNTLFLEKERLNDDNNCNRWGIYVDVFPIDTAKSGRVTDIRRWMVKKLSRVIKHKMGLREDAKMIKAMSALLFSVSVDLLKKFRNFLCKRGRSNIYVISMGNSPKKTEKVLWLKEKLLPVSQVEFEGKMYPAPGDPDYFLKTFFGEDYMKIPPVEKRKTHNPGRISFNTEEGYEEV